MKILIKIKNKKLYLINRKKLDSNQKNMLNTNIINNDEIVFNDTYINENNKLVYTFLNELIKEDSIDTIAFQNMDVALLFLPIVIKFKNINNMYFASDEPLPYKIFEKIIKCPDLKNISAFSMPDYMFELFDKNNIIVESRNEILFTSNFMKENDLTNYSSIFYKTSININMPIKDSDYEDFIAFCDINKHLKVIHTKQIDKENLEKIIDILKKGSRKNIKILIHDDNLNPEVYNYLKKYQKAIEKKYSLNIKHKYSQKYIENNIASETNNRLLRYCGLLILSIIFLSFGYLLYDNYTSMLKVSKIQDEVENLIIEVKENDPNEETLQIKNPYLLSLQSINPDIVAWIKVNNTNIDYAVTQTNDNEYYLKYNLYKEKDPNGWVFMDYENNVNQIDDNIILYGHNRFVNGVAFGTLNKTLYKSWYTNPENQIITLSTIKGTYKYQVFSIYTILTTSDYLTTNFKNKDKKIEFLNTIKNRSIYDFNINLNEESKVLTLSTCNSDTTRLVLHAVLVGIE